MKNKMHVGLIAVFGAAAMLRGDTLIDFEAPLPGGLVPNGSFISGSAVSADAQLTNQYQDLGVLFSTIGGAPYAALIGLGAGHAVSGTNGIGAVNAGGGLSYGQVLDIIFVMPGTSDAAVTDQVSLQGDLQAIGGLVFFSAYDALGNLITSSSLDDTAAATYQLTGAGIHEFQIYSASATVAYDNLAFGPLSPADIGGSVPEPATFGLVAIGIVGAASMRLKRRFAGKRAA
jgi:hypothetical protein